MSPLPAQKRIIQFSQLPLLLKFPINYLKQTSRMRGHGPRRDPPDIGMVSPAGHEEHWLLNVPARNHTKR